jgi:eukaryotic-like serine/threonine-protein kinase
MATQPDNWEAVKALFEAALEEEAANRSSFLKARCPDASVCAEVERLLAEHDEAASFLSAAPLGNIPATPSRLSEGEVLAGRFRIVRFIAGGGMGDVYEADDQELRDRVAVKTIRPEILREADAVARFKREVYLARKVTHFNVCRVFDLFRHRVEGGNERDDIVFISMELLHGKTLGARLKEGGRMSAEEALPVVRQMACALAAAHAAGIVHRDFKPGNVVLVGAPGQWRAVVTDFGLALRSVTSDETASLTTGQGLLGTPAYMSPEQIEGRPATAASDIYALGLVMYEMVTSVRPFQGETPISAALKRLTESPAPPRKLQPGLSALWESVILRCLERDPAQRFTTAKEVTDAFDYNERPSADSRARFRRKRYAAAAAVALLVSLGIATVRYGLYQRQSAMRSSSNAIVRRSVAVLGFKNLSDNSGLNWISTALSEELADELSAGQQLRIVPGETVARLKADLSLPQTDSLASQTLSKIRNALGTDVVVTGSYLPVAERLRVDVQLKNTISGETIATLSDTADENQMLDLVSRIGGALREKCGVVQLTSSQEQAVKTAQAANPAATRFYAEGLEKLRSFDALGARSLFESAIKADGSYALAHSALASAWLQLGYDNKAKQEAEKAVDLGNGLSQEDRLWIEAQFHEASHEETQAVQSLQNLYQIAPDNPEYGLRLANAQLLNGNLSDAASTLATLKKLTVASTDARIDLAEANIAKNVGDYSKALAMADRAQQKADSEGARILVALALMRQSSALDMLGQRGEAIARGEKARRIFSEAGDRDDFAKMNANLALILVRQSKFEEAKRRFQESLDEFREIGDQHAEETMYGQLAWVAENQDDLDGAQKLYEHSLSLARELDDKSRFGGYIGSIALILSYKGDLSGAISKKEEVLAIAKESGQTQLESQTYIDLVGMLLARGDLATAKEFAAHADALLAKTPNSRGKALASQSWGDILATENRLAEAHQKYQDALNMAVQISEKQLVPYCQLSLAELEIDEHHTAESEVILREVIEYFHAQKDNGGEAWALGDYVRAELELGHMGAASMKAKLAKVLAQHDRSLSGLDVHWIVALTEGLTGNVQQAQEELKDLSNEAEKQGNIALAFKVRLARGEIALKSHDESGRKILSDLSKDAAARGFLLYSERTHTIMNR